MNRSQRAKANEMGEKWQEWGMENVPLLEQAWVEAFHLDQIRGVWDDIIHRPRVRVIGCSGEQQEEEELE
jgi:hypothetical protein